MFFDYRIVAFTRARRTDSVLVFLHAVLGNCSVQFHE